MGQLGSSRIFFATTLIISTLENDGFYRPGYNLVNVDGEVYSSQLYEHQ